MIDRPEEYEKMDQTEHQLWWYKILHQQVLQSIQRNKAGREARILDAACGTGGLMHYLMQQGYQSLQGFDASALAVQKSKAKTGKEILCLDLRQAGSSYVPASYDIVVCNDALYFMQDHEFPQVLGSLMALLKPDGQLIINLPAGKLFRGMHDQSVGIKERWSFKKFEKMLRQSGATYRKLEYWYWPFLLAPLIYTARAVQRIRLKLAPSAKITSDVSMPPLVFNDIFYKLTQWERYLPFKRFTGSSLFLVIYR